MVKGCDPATLTVRQLMEDAVVTCSPQASGFDIARILSEWNFGSVPIVDEDKTLMGLVSESDLLDAVIAGKDLRTIKASDLMTKQVVTATEDTKLVDLATLFQDRYLIRVPVVNGRKLVGIVARRDIVFGYVKARSDYWP
jgi:CBS domain-containing protein